MKKILLVFSLLIFAVTAFSQPNTANKDSLVQELKDRYQNALNDCKSDYKELSIKYFTIDSLMQSQNIEIQRRLEEMKTAATEIQADSKKIDNLQTTIKRKEKLLFGLIGTATGIIIGSIL